MLAKDLLALTRICSKISNPSSLTSLYRAIEIGPAEVRCCSEFGNIELTTENSGLTEPVLLDCNALSSVAAHALPTEDIQLTERGNKVHWTTGPGKTGNLNMIQSDLRIPKITHENYPWTPPPELGNALLLASSACQAAAVSFGLYGITLEPEGDKLYLMSSNTIALAASTLEKGSFPTGKVTVRPPVPAIIAALIGSCPNCVMDITSEGIFLRGDWLSAHLPLGSNLDYDLKEIVSKYTKSEQIATIDSNAVKKFINLAHKLSEKNTSFTVQLRVEEGKLILSHEGIASEVTEHFLAQGLDESLTFPPITVQGDLLLLPLQFVQTAVFDYLPEMSLILKGDNPEFNYILSCGSE